MLAVVSDGGSRSVDEGLDVMLNGHGCDASYGGSDKWGDDRSRVRCECRTIERELGRGGDVVGCGTSLREYGR